MMIRIRHAKLVFNVFICRAKLQHVEHYFWSAGTSVLIFYKIKGITILPFQLQYL